MSENNDGVQMCWKMSKENFMCYFILFIGYNAFGKINQKLRYNSEL